MLDFIAWIADRLISCVACTTILITGLTLALFCLWCLQPGAARAILEETFGLAGDVFEQPF